MGPGAATMSNHAASHPHCLKMLKFEKLTVKVAANGLSTPDPRSGHRIVAGEADLYSIGGFNPNFCETPNEEDTCYPLFRELWKFNFASRKWKRLKTNGPMPYELASHSAMLCGRNLFVFGGTGIPFGQAASNQLHVCNLDTLTWSQVKATGTHPTNVYGHTTTLVGKDLVVFGGTTGWEYHSDLHVLDLRTHVWRHIEDPSNAPEGRYRHEVTCHRGKLYVFGGGRSYTVYDFEKIPCFDMRTETWEVIQATGDHCHGFPKARRCHSCVQLHKGVYICGGYDGYFIYDDVWFLDLETRCWTKMAATLPRPVYFHSAAITPQGRMLLYGGVVTIDTERTSDIYSIWLRIPSLRELCWQLTLDLIPDVDRIARGELVELGIPVDLIDRIS